MNLLSSKTIKCCCLHWIWTNGLLIQIRSSSNNHQPSIPYVLFYTPIIDNTHTRILIAYLWDSNVFLAVFATGIFIYIYIFHEYAYLNVSISLSSMIKYRIGIEWKGKKLCKLDVAVHHNSSSKSNTHSETNNNNNKEKRRNRIQGA